MTQLHYLEILPIAIYLIAILLIGFAKNRNGQTPGDFFLGGRQLTLPGFVATLVTTWYGGILGVGEFTYLYGISNWLVFGVPYYLFAFMFARFLARKIQSAPFVSIPDQFYRNYGRSGGILSSIYTFFMVIPAPYVLMVGFLLSWITAWPLWVCICLGACFSMIYVISGGFQAVVRTDKLQFVLMFGGFVLLFATLISQYGGIAFLRSGLPPQHLSWHGGNSLQIIAVWFFIAAWTFVDPGFHQRCYAARSGKVAQRGIFISIGFWFVFDFLTTACGLYARVLLAPDSVSPTLSFPALGHLVLTPLLSGFFLAGLLATIMSTVDSFTHLSTVTLGHDLLGKLRPRIGEKNRLHVGLAISGILSICLAIAIPSVINIWLLIGNIFIPPLLLPLLACYYPALNPGRRWVNANLAFAFLMAMGWLLVSIGHSDTLAEVNFFLGIPPMYPGMLTSLVLFGAGIYLRKKSLDIS